MEGNDFVINIKIVCEKIILKLECILQLYFVFLWNVLMVSLFLSPLI